MNRRSWADRSIHRRLRVAPRTDNASTIPATVSVVIPCYNYADYLRQAVSSALDQDGVNVDVIIVDDASTDDSARVARGLAAMDSRVQVLTHEHNRGAVCTYNTGLERITGEFTVRLDADDMLTPGSLLRSTTVARHFPTVGLVYGHPVHFIEARDSKVVQSGWGRPVVIEPGTRPPFRPVPRRWTIWPGRDWLAERCQTGLNVITSPEVLMRSSIVKSTGGQLPLPHTHDMEMWMRIANYSDIAFIEGADQAWHREHDRSLSGAIPSVRAQLVEQQAAFDLLFENLPQSSENKILHTSARRALSRMAIREAVSQLDRGRATIDSVEELQCFADAAYPKIRRTRDWKTLRMRLALQRRWPVHRSPFATAAIIRRLQHQQSQIRWKRHGT